jgi:hypothetical protein
MNNNHSANLACRRTRRCAAEAWILICSVLGFIMMILLTGCGEKRATGLKLVVVQEFPDASDSRAHVSIVDFDVDPPRRIDLRMGESKQGIELIEVGNPARTALIRRDGKEIRLEMKKGEQDGGGQPATRPESK